MQCRQESALGIDQHLREIRENASRWARKPVLREVYADAYREVYSRLQQSTAGLTVELGSGIGMIKDFIPGCVTTDLFPNAGIDRVENAYKMNFNDKSVANLILTDVWHHLQYPGTALREFRRVLVPTGRLIIFEPAMSLLGRIVYGCFHREPLHGRLPIEWEMPPGSAPESCGYFAAQSYASRIFGGEQFSEKLNGWKKEELRYYASFAYWGSGGFRGPQFCPDRLIGAMRFLDRLFSVFPKWFAAGRMLIVLSKV